MDAEILKRMLNDSGLPRSLKERLREQFASSGTAAELEQAIGELKIQLDPYQEFRRGPVDYQGNPTR